MNEVGCHKHSVSNLIIKGTSRVVRSGRENPVSASALQCRMLC